MNALFLILKKRASLSFCYRTISILPRETLFNIESYKLNSSLLSTEKKSFIFLLHYRHFGILSRVKNSLKNVISNKTKVRLSGNLVYEKVVDDIDYKKFFQYFELPDTFQSWFIVVQLHMWIILMRTIPERHGREFRNSVVDAMWNDVEIRMGELGNIRSSLKKKCLNDLVSQFKAALLSYDEGILSDDTVLAAAAWRTMYACKNIDPELLEKVVAYTRRQLAHLDSANSENIILNGSISFLPLESCLIDIKQ